MRKRFTRFLAALALLVFMMPSMAGWGQTFTRISSVSDLADGDEIIFVNQAETYACGTTQNTNNRTPVAITVSNHSYNYSSYDKVQVFVVRINSSGKYGFHTGSGYIYSASSSNNNLKTNTTNVTTEPSGTAAWSLNVSNYVFSCTNVTNTSYYLAFNGTSYFSQYKSGQSKPYIYKKETGGGSTISTTVTIDDTEITNTDVYASTEAGSLSAIVKDDENNVVDGATVTWISSDTDVATIDEDGVVTLVSAGTTTITASYNGNETYGSSSNTYELTVTSSAPYVQPNPVVINMNYQWLGSGNGSNLNSNQLPVVKTDDNVTTTITDGTSTRPRGDADYIRIYTGSTLTFAAPDGFDISSIVFTTGGNNTWNAPSASPGTLTDKTWTGQSESVTFTLSGSCFISSVSITLTVPQPTISADPATAQAFTYVVGNGPSDDQMFTITGTNLVSADITATVSSDYEITDNTDYSSSVTIASGDIVAVRLKADLAKGTHNGTLTLSSTDATDVVINLSGTVTGQTYSIEQYTAPATAHGTITFSPASPIEEGTEVTLSAEAAAGYDFTADSWVIYKQSGEDYVVDNSITVTANKFYMPQYAIWVDATFTAKPTYGITCVASPVAGGEIEASPASAYEGQTVTLSYLAETGYNFSSIVITKTSNGSATGITPTASGGNFTFTMPGYAVTATATFVEHHSLDIDFENAMNTYTNWVYSNIIAEQTEITPHGGSKYGKTNGTTTAYIQTKDKIASPGTFVCYISKIGTNTNANSYWKVQYSSDGSTWTTQGDNQAAADGITEGTWTKIERDLSSQSNVYIRVYYDGTTAVRTIDDISLEYTPSEYAVTLSSVSGGTISASDGTTTITSGSGNFETGKTITLTAEDDATHMFSSWSVTETVSGDAVEVTDNSFEMPACAVTVSATFVESWTFTYNINGNVVAEKYAKNDASITLPTTSEYVPEGYAIIGWTETEGNVSSPITSVEASGNRTLYAVFGKITYSDFTLVESAPSNWSGYYLIVYNNQKVLDTHYHSLNTNSYATIADISEYYSNKVITYNATTALYMVKIEKTTNGYSIYDKDGYLGNSNNSNGSYLRWDEEFTASQDEWTLGVNSIVGVKNSGKAIRYNESSPRFAIYGTTEQASIQLFKTTVSYEGAYTHIYPSDATATGDIDVSTSGPIVIESGATLDMSTYTLTCTDPAKLIIEDGGQLKVYATGAKDGEVQATVEKNITHYTVIQNHDEYLTDGWYFIASPINSNTLAPTNVTNMLSNTYDLYQLNNTSWENYKEHAGNANPGFNLANGRGYLYANREDVTLSFAGAIKPFNKETPTANQVAVKTGWNLIGNPFTFNVYADVPYYAMNAEGTGITANTVATSTAIAPCTSIVIKAENAGTVNFSETSPVLSTGDHGNIQMVLAHNVNVRGDKRVETIDNAIVSFNEGSQLGKFYFGTQNANIYIPMDNEEYAIVSSNAQGEMPVNFRAYVAGEYTITVNPEEVEMGYLHLIDNIAGKDVDLIATPSYTFNARTDDYESRFRLVFSANMTNAEMGEDFAFISDGQLVIANEGESLLQVIDVNGRIVMTESVNGTCSKAINAKAGVYVLRLINGTDVKTQKMVIR